MKLEKNWGPKNDSARKKKKIWTQKILGSEKITGPKKNLDPKKKIAVQRIIQPEKIIFLGPKDFGSKMKISGLKNEIGSKKMLVEKNFGPQKNLGNDIFGLKKTLCPKKILGLQKF